MRKLFILLSFAAFSAQAQQGTAPLISSGPIPLMKQHQLLLHNNSYAPLTRTAAKGTSAGPIFDTTNWAHLVDSTWGTGISTANKLDMFDFYWHKVDSAYPCFIHLPNYNWDSVVNAKRTDINTGVSRGRYAGIIGDLMSYINDGHSAFFDYTVDYGSPIYPGKPIFRGESGLFGACITPVDDTVAMVYEAEATHPFGLQRGDIILGYNGLPWTKLIDIILRHQLPNTVYKGSTASATYHRYIQAAGENWYLFDTINIKKCDGSLVNLPTSLMAGHNYSNFCTEQLPVNGVPKLTYTQYYNQNLSASSGVITGTRIGYVYLYDCMQPEDTLYKHVRALVEDSMITGLILDIRTNFGGGFLSYEKTYTYLANLYTQWVGYGERDDSTNRYSLFNDGLSAWYDVPDTDPATFQYPIAILCGPNAVSAGDFFSVLFKHYDRVRTFGLSSAGAYGAYGSITMPYANYYGAKQLANFFRVEDPTYYITHTMYPVDQPTWFNKNSVCNGIDNVVTDAVTWIEGVNAVGTASLTKPDVKVFPNPSKGDARLMINCPRAMDMHIALYNVTGAVIQNFSAALSAGENSIDMELGGLHLPTGTYYITLRADGMDNITRKLVIAK